MANIFDNNTVYRQFMQNSGIDHYQKIENELQTLSEEDITALMAYEPYVASNNQLSMVIQGELLKLVRMQVNQHYDVIDNVVKSIKDFKKNKDNELRDFQDYIKNFSEMSYQDYIKLKYDKK